MEYLFDGTEPDGFNEPTHYWLASQNQATTITINFPDGQDLTRIVLVPRARTDSPAPSFAVTVVPSGGEPELQVTPSGGIAGGALSLT
eukprot:SAG31_NODE_851_length_11519_cov_4.727145_7_plen_88_part_00